MDGGRTGALHASYAAHEHHKVACSKKMHEKAEWRHAKSAKGLTRLYKAQNSKGKRHNTILSTTKIPPTSLTLI